MKSIDLVGTDIEAGVAEQTAPTPAPALPQDLDIEALLSAVRAKTQASNEQMRRLGYHDLDPRPEPTKASLRDKLLGMEPTKREALYELFRGPDAGPLYRLELGATAQLMRARSYVVDLCEARPMPEKWRSDIPLPELEVIGYQFGMCDGRDWAPNLIADHIGKGPGKTAALLKAGHKKLRRIRRRSR